MMNKLKIAITTDTNSGMLPHEADDKGLFVLPMPFIVDDTVLLESIDLSRDEFYEKLKGNARITTSQPSTEEVTDFWRELLKNYDAIVHIPTSTLLSNSCATAQNLAKEEEFAGKVFVVDNKRMSFSLKSSAYDGVTLRDQGKSPEEIQAILEETAQDYVAYFSLTSMEYLKRGGRISPTVAAIGSMLKLRPVLSLKGGKLEKFSTPRTLIKAKEVMKEAIKNELATTFKTFVDNGEMRLCLIYSDNIDDAEAFKQEIEKDFPNIPVEYFDPMSLSIACHVGPGTLALGCYRVLK